MKRTDWFTAGCVVKYCATPMTLSALASVHGILHENHVDYFAYIEFVSYLWLLVAGMG